jgi:hypothetical protein
VTDSFSSDATFKSATALNGCTGTVIVDCAVGPIAPGGTAVAKVVVTSPSTVPDSGTIENVALASPGSNASTTEFTVVEEPEEGVSKGFVGPGESIETPGDDPAVLTLPDEPPDGGAAVIITQGSGTFCAGPCSGTTTTIDPFPGYTDPNNPIHLTLTWEFPDSPTSLREAAYAAFGATIYKNTDPEHPEVGSTVPACDTPGSGVASPHPCVDARDITQPTPNSFVVTVEIVYLSGDPRFGRK